MSNVIAVVCGVAIVALCVFTAFNMGAVWQVSQRARILCAAALVGLLTLAGFLRYARGADSGAPAGCQPDTFYLVGSIGPEIVPHFAAWLKTARNPLVIIDSPGGSMGASVALVGAIGERGDVRCRVVGVAASGAFAVLQACAVREMVPHAWLMTHEPRMLVMGALDRVKAAEFLAHIDGLSKEWNALAGKRLRLAPAEYESRVKGKDWTFGPGEAMRVGAIDRVLP